MLDGMGTDRLAVDDRALIKKLGICLPFSLTDNQVRYDLRLPGIHYKGMYLVGRPCLDELGRYLFSMRGSLINLANNGLHNYDAKDPFEILLAIDDLVMTLGINPFIDS